MLLHHLSNFLRGAGLALGIGVMAAAFLSGSRAAAGPVYIVVQDGFAIGGYDPVSYHDAQTPLRGQRDYALMWKGAVWLFHTAHNQSRFEADPRSFAPRFGGHCAYGLATGHASVGDPETWEIVDGQLYLFNSSHVRGLWRQDRDGMLKAARAAWPEALHQE